MFEASIILLFCAILLAAVIFHIPLIIALIAGLFLFLFYGLKKGHTLKGLLLCALRSSLKARIVAIIMALIGIMTGVWRASGTIAYIVTVSSHFFYPQVALFMIFLLNCGVSFLIGTSFGTAASMGTICMTIANLMGLSPMLTGGAILSGAFFGDRCSPLSSSAALVAASTDTDLYKNIKAMLKSGFLPFLLTAGLYLLFGCVTGANVSAPIATSTDVFADAFSLSAWCIVPAILVLLLALLKVPVQYNISASIVTAFFVGLLTQNLPVSDLFFAGVFGFYPEDSSIAMLSGGGLVSMINVIAIVCVASSYAGVLTETGIADSLSGQIANLSKKITPYGSTVVVSVICCMLSCNQSFPILMSAQLLRSSIPDKEQLALYIENSIITLAPMIPWCIAGAVPIATLGAPTLCLAAGFYLYLLPLVTFIREFHKIRSH